MSLDKAAPRLLRDPRRSPTRSRPTPSRATRCRLDLPSSFGFGLSWRLRDTLTLSADYTRSALVGRAHPRLLRAAEDAGLRRGRQPRPAAASPILSGAAQYPTLGAVPDPDNPDDPARLVAQQDAEQIRAGVEWVLIKGRFKVPLRGGYFNDRQITPAPGGDPVRFNGVTAGTGIILGALLLDLAWVYEFGEYFVAAETTAADAAAAAEPDPLRAHDEPRLRLDHLPLQRALAALMGAERPPLASVETVREELRRLGYLDSSLDRFVLTGASGATPLGASLRAATRVGLVGGVLFGVAATLAAAGLDRRLLGRAARPPGAGALPRRRLRAAHGSGRPRGWPPRRVGAAARPRGRERTWRVAWASPWRSSPSSTSRCGGARTWASRACRPAGSRSLVGLVLSLALSRFASLAVIAVLSAGGAALHLPPASLSRRRVRAARARRGRRLRPGPRRWRRGCSGPRPRSLPISRSCPRACACACSRSTASSGAWPSSSSDAARCRRSRRSLARGAHARLRAEPERVPAIVWTTIATGRGPEAHGILSADTRRHHRACGRR